MEIAVVGTGFVGGILSNALARSGHTVRFGSRHPGDDRVAAGTTATVVGIGAALDGADAVILSVPGSAVAELCTEHSDRLAEMLVVDATNRMGTPAANCRADLPPGVRYTRAFNTLGGESMADPRFADGPADPSSAPPRTTAAPSGPSSPPWGCGRSTWVPTRRRSSSTASSVCGSHWPCARAAAGGWPGV
jgi:hypothetical protein